jgi:hypothetical protein
MAALTWDDTGKRFYETGVDKGVLYIPDGAGVYANGVAWNGLTTVTESPSGAEGNAQYADNIKYLNLVSAEEFGATIEALTYPDEFAPFDGLDTPTPGVFVGQQTRKKFGLSYRTRLGNDLLSESYGYKLHLMYGCMAAPSEKAYSTINDSPSPIAFSWAITTTGQAYDTKKPTALITIDSTKVLAANLTALELLLYGTTGVSPVLPTPDAVVAAITSGLTSVAAINPPTYVSSSHVMTIVATTGVDYYITKLVSATGAVVTAKTKAVAGAQVALTTGQEWIINAVPQSGYVFADGTIDEWQVLFASADRTGT